MLAHREGAGLPVGKRCVTGTRRLATADRREQQKWSAPQHWRTIGRFLIAIAPRSRAVANEPGAAAPFLEVRVKSRSLFVFVCAMSLAAFAGCGDDGDDTGDDGTPDAGGGGGGGTSPDLTEVSWAHAQPCTQGTAGEVTVTMTVVDDDTPQADLTFSGTIPGCSGEVDANPATLTCPNAAPYTGTVNVTDPEGNRDFQEITIEVCVDGSAP